LAAHNDNNTNVILKGLNLSTDTTIQQIYNALKGTYTWNIQNQEWDTTANSSDIEFDFPDTSTATTDNVKLVITFTATSSNYSVEGYNGNMPASFTITLSESGKTLAEISYTATYNSNGFPTTLNSFVQITPYKLGETWNYSNTGVSGSWYFMNGSTYLIDFNGSTVGNYGKSVIDTATTLSSVLKTANFSLVEGNIELAGNINYTNINDSMNMYNTTSEANATDLANLINRNASLVLFYVKPASKIANASAVVIPEVPLSGPTTYQVQLEYIFSNGEPESLDTYFSSVISEFQNATNSSNSK
jgi:hypothetical protein